MKTYKHKITGVEVTEQPIWGLYEGEGILLPKELVEISKDWELKEYEVLHSDGKGIHSIKRIPDGEVFTVGDVLVGGHQILGISLDYLWFGGVKLVCDSTTIALASEDVVKDTIATNKTKKLFSFNDIVKIYNDTNTSFGKINHTSARIFREMERQLENEV